MAQAEKRMMWAPRTGLTEAFDDWKHDVLLRLARLGFNSYEELLAWLPPTQVGPNGTAMAQTATGGSVTRSRAGDAAADSDDSFSARLEWYQRVNSEVFDIIAPSLILEGTHKTKDRDTLRKYINGPIRDGRGLLEWALTWTALDSFDTQSALLSSLYAAKLPSNATCMSLYNFCCQLLQCWSRCAGNDPNTPASLDTFWLLLASKLPTSPDTSKIVMAHRWLIDKRLDKSTLLTDASLAIETMCDYLKAHGLSSGGYNDELTRNFGGFDEKAVMGIGNDNGPPNPNGGGKGKKYSSETCDCNNCDSYFCTKENRAKACGRCICDPNSTFDVRKQEYGIHPGGRRYIYLMRGYGKDNPGKKLKGISFQLVKQAAKDKEKPGDDAKKGDKKGAQPDAAKGNAKNSASLQPLMSIGDALNIQGDAVGAEIMSFLDEMDNLLPGVSMMAGDGDDVLTGASVQTGGQNPTANLQEGGAVQPSGPASDDGRREAVRLAAEARLAAEDARIAAARVALAREEGRVQAMMQMVPCRLIAPAELCKAQAC